MIGMGSYSKTPLRPSIKVGNYSSIAAGCYFHEVGDQHLCVSNRKCVYTTNWDQPVSTKETVIGHDVWIGHGAQILSGIKIGNGAIIGAHSIVAKDVPPFAVVVGNPAKITRFRFNDEQIKRLQQIRWWNWKNMDVRMNELKNIDEFLNKYAK